MTLVPGSEGGVCLVLVGLDLHTRAKWPVLLQLLHATRNAGQFLRPPWWNLDPHPGHVWVVVAFGVCCTA